MRSKIALLPFALLGLADAASAQPLLQMASEAPPEATLIARSEGGQEAAMPLVDERLEV